ncbi:DUF6457 domain-containing protein [Actinophytocola sp. KF-1]
MDDIADWTSKACVALGIDAGQAGTAEVLALAGEVRRAVGEPAAVMAVYLLGVAAGRGADRGEAAARLADLAKQWSGSTCDWRD